MPELERIAVLETKVEGLEESLAKIEKAVEELKPVVWKAAGAATVLLAAIQFLTKGFH